MASILNTEVLGIISVVLPPKPSSIQSLWAIAGCTTDISEMSAGCRPTTPAAHVVFEAWDSAMSGSIDALRRAVGSAMPDDLGSTGYDGVETLYVPRAPKMTALRSQGLALEFYRSYNVSWHSPSVYFENFANISVEGLLPCRKTKFNINVLMEQYVRHTGDADGVEVVNGSLAAKCEGGIDGHWWFSPACRGNPQTCIPVIDGGDGWFIDVFMQRAAVFNMPLAISVGTWAKYASTPIFVDMMFYWWHPDITFLQLRPSGVKFPTTDLTQWQDGRKTTESLKVVLRKWDVICWSTEQDSDHLMMMVVSLVALSIPLAVFTKVVLLVRRYPVAMRRGDVDFLRSYGFVFFRFRPQAHWYVVVVMSRSLFVGIVPVVPRATAQTYLLQFALLAPLATCTHFKPWRVPNLNWVAVCFEAIMLIFLNIAAFMVSASDASVEVIGWMSVMTVVLAVSMVPLALLYAACKHCGNLAKHFEFFLCHCKAEAGAFARWLKMEFVALFGSGISLELVQQSLSSFMAKEATVIPHDISTAMPVLVSALADGDPTAYVSIPNRGPATASTVIVADTASFEANAAAHVLEKLLAPMSDNVHDFPRVLPAGFSYPESAQRVLFVFTSGCLSQLDFVERLLAASDIGLQVLPVIADDDFCIPGRNAVDPVVWSRLRAGDDGRPWSVGEVSCVILGLFQEIAVSLPAGSASATMLDAIAQGLGQRLMRRKLRTLWRATMTNSQSTQTLTDEGEEACNEASVGEADAEGPDSLVDIEAVARPRIASSWRGARGDVDDDSLAFISGLVFAIPDPEHA